MLKQNVKLANVFACVVHSMVEQLHVADYRVCYRQSLLLAI